jgi:hypothetical protein
MAPYKKVVGSFATKLVEEPLKTTKRPSGCDGWIA